MTLNNAAWAIDGALSKAALARTETYAANSGSEGVVNRSDLKVTQLDTPGQGLKISGGAGLVLNRYQTNPSQMYVVTNDGSHTVGSSLMPAANAAEKTYIVAIGVGDKEFSQAGHPFMLASDPPAGQEATFAYVRPIIILETSFNSRAYPAIPLARLVIPANTTTITNAMLSDIRTMSRARRSVEVENVAGPSSANTLNGGGGTPGTYERWPNVGVLTVEIPSWASKAKIMGFVEGTLLSKAGNGNLRAHIDGTSKSTPVTNLNENDPGAGGDRRSYSFAGTIDVSDISGQTKTFSVEATPSNTASKGAWTADGQTSVAMQVFFEEKPL